MFALVKYNVDKQTEIVPVSFIKEFNVENFVEGAEFQVFWSPKDGQVPDDLLADQGFILDLDEVKDKKIGVGKEVMAGNYRAKVLKIGESKKELEQKIESKRVSIPSTKAADILCMKAKKAKKEDKQKDTPNSPVKPKSAKEKELKRNASNANIDRLQKKFTNVKAADGSSSDDDDELVIKTEFQREIDRLKTQLKLSYAKLTKKTEQCGQLEKECQELRRLNMRLQDKLLSTPEPTAPAARSLFATSPNHSSRVTSIKQILDLTEPDTKAVGIPQKSAEVEAAVEIPNIGPLEKKGNEEDQYGDDSQDSQDSDQEHPFALTKETIDLCKARLKKGEAGDSVFCKNVAVALWGSERLAKSSVTGLKSNAVKDSKPKPALSPVKLDYLRVLLKKKILNEIPKPPRKARLVRQRLINKHIASKITTLTRPAK